MRRCQALSRIVLVGLHAALVACYAVPERHAVSSETDGIDAGTDGDVDPDAATPDAPSGEGDRDAAGGCRCSDPTPVCVEPTKTCVACTATDRGACTAEQVCDVLRGECVECLQNADCKDARKSVCEVASHTCQPCAEGSASDCSHIEDKHVCLASECVECTKDKLAACLVQDSPTKTTQYACHAISHTCTNYELRKTPPCGECVSDAQCTVGHVCVTMEFGGQPIPEKWYCQPVLEALNCNGERPYIGLGRGEVTIEGETADVCTLRMSSCSAHGHYSRKYCGLDSNDRPVALNDGGVPIAPSVKGDDTLCGLPGLADGYCVEAQPGLHRCTVVCDEILDCPGNAPACAQQMHGTEMKDLCTVL
jgi:hypothetical protein